MDKRELARRLAARIQSTTAESPGSGSGFQRQAARSGVPCLCSAAAWAGGRMPPLHHVGEETDRGFPSPASCVGGGAALLTPTRSCGRDGVQDGRGAARAHLRGRAFPLGRARHRASRSTTRSQLLDLAAISGGTRGPVHGEPAGSLSALASPPRFSRLVWAGGHRAGLGEAGPHRAGTMAHLHQPRLLLCATLVVRI